MSIYMSVDGGGTKLFAVLFDEKFHLVGVGMAGSVNPNFENEVSIKNNMQKCIEDCIRNIKIDTIKKVYVCMPGDAPLFLKLLAEKTKIEESCRLSEGQMSLLAAAQTDTGILVLAGTGSGIFWINHGKAEANIGGWGSLLGDEGSGYDIGRNGIAAAIADEEGWGGATRIKHMLIEHCQLNSIREFRQLVYQADVPRHVIASVALVVSKAAQSGDAIAKEIFICAGQILSKQTDALIKKNNRDEKIQIMVSGSVWKGWKGMFDSFCICLRQTCPNAEILLPLFEPVMGGVIKEANAQGKLSSDMKKHIENEFEQFLYKTDWQGDT